MTPNLITALVDRVRANRALVFCGVAFLFIAGWGAMPLMQPYARVPGHTVEFVLPCVPDELGINFRSKESRILKAELTVNTVDDNGALAKQIVQPSDMRVVQSEDPASSSSGSMLLSEDSRKAISVNLQTRVSAKLVLFLQKRPFTDIQQVELRRGSLGLSAFACETRTYAGADLKSLIPRDTGFKLLYVNLIQDRLSDYLLLFNSSVGNLALMVLCAVLLWAVWRVGDAMIERWRVRDGNLTEVANKVVAEMPSYSAETFREELAAQFWNDCRWSNFWKVAGPAIGFLLTVSSLAASLHPSVQAARDAYVFVSGIQMAVISTFVGLFIRICAHIDTSIRQNSLHRLASRVTTVLEQKGTEPSTSSAR